MNLRCKSHKCSEGSLFEAAEATGGCVDEDRVGARGRLGRLLLVETVPCDNLHIVERKMRDGSITQRSETITWQEPVATKRRLRDR